MPIGRMDHRDNRIDGNRIDDNQVAMAGALAWRATAPPCGLCRAAAWIALLLILCAQLAGDVAAAPRRAVVLDIEGAIGPATADFISRELAALTPETDSIAILRLDTPGGLDTSMREIIRAILAAPVPVIAYVAPRGARAASAGTYIAYACSLAAMAPGTNLGAATPIQLAGPPLLPGGQPEQPPAKPDHAGSGNPPVTEPADAESRKMINDAVAYIRSLAELNNRNADWAEQAVRAAVSLPASEALRQHVVDVIADDIPDLLHQIDGRTVTIRGKPLRLATGDLVLVTIPPDWRTELLGILTNPNVAYLLLLIGAYGLFFEFTNPGAVLPGVLGGISLLLALFAFNLLPVNYAGAALVLLGIGLMVAEAFIGSFGAIGLGGVAAFAIGSIIMFRADVPGFGLSLSVIIAATIVTAGFFLLILSLLLRSRRRPVITGREAMIGMTGEIITWDGRNGRVRVMGEVWQAETTASVPEGAAAPLAPGGSVRVVGRTGLILRIEPR
ncbi:MAG TPA: nodulation protein NfeD [Dongiaceae bacterium]|nr:nodulation protein NfeD [Dongiaceae bacterium]